MSGDKLQTVYAAQQHSDAPGGILGALAAGSARLDHWLWDEREALFIWLPVMLGIGIALWFVLPSPQAWGGAMAVAVGLCLAGQGIAQRYSMLGRTIIFGAAAMALGVALIWIRAESVAAPVLERPAIVSFSAKVEQRELLPARGDVRLTLRPRAGQNLPEIVRVTARLDDRSGAAGILAGDYVGLRARLVPPPRASLPGGYDFSRAAWFRGIGAVGTVLGPIARSEAPPPPVGLRDRLAAQITGRVAGGAGGIAAAFATGDRGAIPAEDDEAMRRSGLSHLLSISGLHVTAAVGGAMWLVLRLLAFVPGLALRWPLGTISAGAGALTGIFYTLLTGAEVPTVRSLVAALLVLGAVLLGRDAISLRLVAAGALVVLLLAPESLVGPSFQLSFAAVTAIIALHSSGWMMRHFAAREEHLLMRGARSLAALLMTGIAVEIALAPIALYHFHRSGLYGGLANIIAIPLTTLVVMPAEALALTLDTVGLGAPLWWVVERALSFLLWMAHSIASAPGAVSTISSMPLPAFAAGIIGGLWLALWRSPVRFVGAVPFVAAIIIGALQAPPDVLITSDGRHVATITPGGDYAMLRGRAGEFVRNQMAEALGQEDVEAAIVDQENARCSPDFCVWQVAAGGGQYSIMASRSGYLTDWAPLVAACARVDIVISDRRLPRGCTPRWFKADRAFLRETGGLAIWLNPPRLRSVAESYSGKPWENPPTIMPPQP